MHQHIGRIVVKKVGREAGRKCVVVDVINERTLLITGPKSLNGVRRRNVNVSHVVFTPKSIKIEKSASDEEVLRAIEMENLSDYMKERITPGLR
ncbi:MAG: 50S ribosomal protein L14e [Aigarchaeota archaeon]|nr:50S ribosomal protein L14e [Aigarchaeota archaeon]MDW8092824.1 50S ribosomal protein L14e [Nitrososphaerota archaeon]